MKIRSRVILSVIIFCIITLIIAVTLSVTFRRVNELDARQDTTDRLLLQSYEISELSNDYILFHDKRQLDQWELKYNLIDALLAQLQVTRPEELILVNNFTSSHKRLKEIFNEVRTGLGIDSGSIKTGDDIELLQLSWARLAVQTQEMIHNVSQLTHLTRAKTRKAHHRTTILIMAMMLTLIVFILSNYILINRRVLRSLANLQEGTAIIGKGNLDYRIEDSGEDEIGYLARSFNQMNENLAKVMASREELNHEVEERKKKDIALLESEEKYRNIFNNAGVGMFRSRLDGSEVFDLNDKYLKILNRTREEVKSKPSVILWAHPHEREEMVRKLKTDGHVSSLECRLLTAQGEERTCLTSLRLYPESAILEGSIMDITDRKKMDEQIQTSLKEKKLLLREIHHRVKNNLQVISSLIRLQATDKTEKSKEEALSELSSRIDAIAMVHEHFYKSPNLADIGVQNYFQNLVNSIFSYWGLSGTNVSLKMDVEDITWHIDTAIPVGLIVNELVINAFKHAFQDSRDGEIRISLCSIDHGEYELIVADNGVGIPEGVDPSTSKTLGLDLVGMLADQLHADVELSRENGTEFRMRFKEAKKGD